MSELAEHIIDKLSSAETLGRDVLTKAERDLIAGVRMRLRRRSGQGEYSSAERTIAIAAKAITREVRA